QERGDLAGGETGEELLLLLGSSNEREGLRNADRLVRREQDRDGGVGRSDHHQRTAVVEIGQPEAAVLLVDLHAEGAELREPGDHVIGDVGVPLNLSAVDGLGELLDLLEERLALRLCLGARLRQRVYQVEAQPAKAEFLTQARFAPFLLPSHLGYLPGLTFGYLGPGGGRAALRRGHGHPLRGFGSCLQPGYP